MKSYIGSFLQGLNSALAKFWLGILLASVGLAMISTPVAANLITFSDNWGNPGFDLIQQTDSGVEIVFSVHSIDMTDVTIDGESMTAVTLPGAFLPNNAGAPDLPGMGRFIAIPQGATAHLEILDSRTEVYHNLNIAPAYEIPFGNDDSPLRYQKDRHIYNLDALYPSQPVTMSEPTAIRGVDAVIVGVTPFQYNPVTRDLIIYKDLRLRITFSGGNGHFGDDLLRSRWWEPVLQQNLLNYESLPEIDFNRILQSDETNVEYLIIIPNDPDFVAWADTLKRWRNEQGIRTGITTISEIGGNSTTLIENYINNAYNNWAIRPVAVLLLSDYQSSADLYGITAPMYSYSSYSCASDNFYADVNGNHLPDLTIARICAQNYNHLQRIITKMLDYERQPPTSLDYYRRPLIAGGWQTSRWFILCCEVILGYLQNVQDKIPTREYAIYSGTPGTVWSTATNTSAVVNYFGPTGLGYIPATPAHLTDWGGNATRINNDINNGCFIIQHRDHGAISGWGEPAYGISNLTGLSNTMLPFVFSINCETGRFYSSEQCFAEAFHRMQYGALGLTAATNVSFSFVNDAYVWGMYDYMFPGFDPGYGSGSPSNINPKPAFASASGKIYLQASSFPYNTSDKTCTYYLFHHHGDAFMSLNTEVPTALTVTHESTVPPGDTIFTVTAPTGSLIGLSHNGALLGAADGTGTALPVTIAPLTSGNTLRVTVTKPNHYRYIADVPCILSTPQIPETVDGLTINRTDFNIRLSWFPVTQDTSGNPIAISYYVIYRSSEDPYFEPSSEDSIGVTFPPGRNYYDLNALTRQMYYYNVKAVATSTD